MADIIGATNTLLGFWEVVVMVLLLAGSAYFSGSETAFFSLPTRQRIALKKSDHRLEKLTAALLAQPKNLLGCLLFGNIIVNVLFFAVSSVFTLRIRDKLGLTAAAVSGAAAFAVLVLFGEVLPKSLAYANSRAISIAAALPAYTCLRVLTPILSVFRLVLVEPVIRLLLGPARPAKPVTAAEFRTLIDKVRRRGLITHHQNKLLSEIVEFGFLKVRHVMRPRVDMITASVVEAVEKPRELMQKNRLTKIPVYSGHMDNIVGLVCLRRVLLEPHASLDKLAEPVNFVPEQKTVESLLEFFRTSGTDTAVVVDEYGGLAGYVCLEDIAEELLGPIEFVEGIESVESIGPFQYRLAADIPLHDWAEAFGIDLEQARYTTIGGLVTAILGRVPKTGDVARLRNLKFTVERMTKNRVVTVILNLEPIAQHGE